VNVEKNEALVKKGEYLSKMGDCISCHTNVKAGTGVYAGGLPIETPFGTFYSPNITPDKKTGIGRWTEADFIRALKEGKNPKGQHYFPVFPYVSFSNLTEEDLRALYAYFMSIPAIEQENKSLPFPFNVPGARVPLIGWNLLFFYPNVPYEVDKTQTKAWNRGKYIVDGLGHCTMCHTPLNPLGGVKQNYYLTGTFIDGYWAPNITKQGLLDVTAEDIANFFKNNMLLNDAGPVAGPMAEVNHNSLNYMTPEDRLAIATYLKTVVSEDALALKPSEHQSSSVRGREINHKVCSICHQDGKMTAPLIGDGHAWMYRLKQSGLKALYQHVIKGYNSMPIRGACTTCSDEDIVAAVDYLLEQSLSRSQWIDLQSNGEKRYPEHQLNQAE
ncbi:MAG: c-type cytochrome, partial [Legionellaceae bacterium]